jgi:hypothetical protein
MGEPRREWSFGEVQDSFAWRQRGDGEIPFGWGLGGSADTSTDLNIRHNGVLGQRHRQTHRARPGEPNRPGFPVLTEIKYDPLLVQVRRD